MLSAAACGPAPATQDAAVDTSRTDARLADLEERFTPGLHTLMVEVGMRHAMLWFAGDAGNWPLVDYQLHEVEELLADIETLHPVYDGVEVARLLGEMTRPAMDALEAAEANEDGQGFITAYDQLTQACNSCHIAADRAALRIQRPTTPPQTNLDFRPTP